MKWNMVFAVVYGVVSVGLGAWLVGRGTAGKGGDTADGPAGVPIPPPADEPGGGWVAEVGPVGIQWTPMANEGTPPGPIVDRPAESREEMEQRLHALAMAVAPRLPESGKELLRLGDPVIQAVADLLTGAGATEPLLEVALRGVFGHVQRLATFQRLARMDAERAAEQEREYASLEPGERPPTPPPSLHWREEVWRRRSQAYAEYMRRDLEIRLGIQDEAVPRRLIAIADDLVTREKGPVPGEPTPVETRP